ncbi:MAG: heparinase II/III domain-containing protein [Armatimonadota bacterium]
MKTSRALHTDDDVARARRHIAGDPAAAAVLEGILKTADEWAAREDDWLVGIITPASVPRAFNVHHEGCPVHGAEIFKHGGNYSFTFSIDRPFKIVCPVGGEEYPSNDFAAFLATGMTDRSLLTGEYADDGWGWRKPGDDRKWWFVAYYNHFAWWWRIIPGILALSRAYLLTGRLDYAHKAALLLHRTADVYPEMDHNKQSRYATEFVPSYQGRIVNCIWETGVGSDFAEAYDNLFDAWGALPDLESNLDKSSIEIRSHIEQHLLDEVIAGVYRGQIRGNYGMHQHTLLTTALVRGGREQEAVDFVLKTVGYTGCDAPYTYEGIEWLMDNLLHRDGVSVSENSPQYALSWVDRVVKVAEMLKKLGIDLYHRFPKMRELFIHPLREMVIGCTPHIGDSGGVGSGRPPGRPFLPRWLAEIGWREYRDPRLYECLREWQQVEEQAPVDYEGLFQTPFVLPEEAPPPLPHGGINDEFDGAYNFGGYGLALLRAGAGVAGRGLALWYGPSIGHGHRDKLFIELYARGRRMLPDLGYPLFTDDHPEQYAWTANTISHATVVVDERMQTEPAKGDLHLFAAAPGAQVAEASAESNYPGIVRRYRRTTALIDLSPEESYVVDIFRVRGGGQHDYSLHGPYGELEVQGVALSEPRPGTLADEDVPFEYLYDAPELCKPGAVGFYNYLGSGYSYIKTPRYGKAAVPWSATWRLKELDGRLNDDQLTILRLPVAEEELFAGIGLPPQKGNNPPELHYLVSRRTGEELDSTFVSILIPHGEHCPVRSARLLHVGDKAVALAVEREGGTDIVISSYDPDATLALDPDIVFHGRFGVITLEAGQPVRATLFGGGELTAGGQGVRLPGSITGVVTALDLRAGEVTVTLDDPGTLPDDLSALLLRELLVSVATDNVPGRDHRACGLRIHAARREGGLLVLGFGPQSLQIARLPLHDIDMAAGTAKTVARLPLAAVGYYDGAYARDDTGADARIARLQADGGIEFMPPAELCGTELRLFEAGPGDRVRIDSVGTWER